MMSFTADPGQMVRLWDSVDPVKAWDSVDPVRAWDRPNKSTK